jgi:hypothetical protein
MVALRKGLAMNTCLVPKTFGLLLFSGATVFGACGQGSHSSGGSDAGGDAVGIGSNGSNGGGASGSGSGVAGGSSGASGASSGGAPSGDGSVLQHHMHASRDGVYTDALMTAGYAKTLKLDTTFNPAINGDVYAQPLYVKNGPGGKEVFVVVTEQNHAMAIDGKGAVVWEHPSSPTDTTNFGPPVTGVHGALGCGNIDPLGITGTPVIDEGTRTVYFDAMTFGGGTPTHKIYGLSLDDGTIKPGWPVTVDTAVAGFTSKGHNQRGALALVDGVVYVPYGGHYGDCGSYQGWVIGVNGSNPSSVTAFSTKSIANASRGGSWAPGGIASDGASLFVSTGNTGGATTWGGGEAVLRLSPGPQFANQSANAFYPAEWMAEDGRDEDLGSANPIVWDMADPSGGMQHLIFQTGKDGYLYVLDRDSLGGMAGQLSRTQVGPLRQGGPGALNGAPAAYATANGTYVAYRIRTGGTGTSCPSGGASNSIGVAQISGSPPTPKVIWCTTEAGLGSPMVTTSGSGDVIVWDANTHLYGYDGDTGMKVFDGSSFTMAAAIQSFNAPIDAGGRVVVATAPGHLYVFKP